MHKLVIRNSSFIIIVLLLLVAACGCHSKKSVYLNAPPKTIPSTHPPEVAPPPEAAPPAVTPPLVELPKTAPIEPAPLPTTISAPSSFDLGERAFRAGDYPEATKFYETFLSSNRESKDRAEALYKLGLSRALATGTSRDMRQAEDAFRRLINEFPESTQRKLAEFILSMLNQIEKLKAEVKDKDDQNKKLGDELNRLKEIDLSRRPARPPE